MLQQLSWKIIQLFSVILMGASAWARDGHFKAGLFGGTYLPRNIEGVTEVMKGTGFRAAYFEHVIGVEAWGFRSVEDGSIVNYLGASMVTGFEVPDVPEIEVLVLFGPSWAKTYGATPASGNRTVMSTSGFHYGGGALFKLDSNWSCRGGFTLINSPGRAVIVEAGFEYRFGAGENSSP